MRALLACLLLLLILFSGCTDPTPEPLREEGTATVAPGDHHVMVFGLNPPADLAIRVEVLSGPDLDVMVMTYVDYQGYVQAKEKGTSYGYRLIEACGGVASGVFTRTCTLDTSNVAILIEHGEDGESVPPEDAGDAEVSWSYTFTAAEEAE